MSRLTASDPASSAALARRLWARQGRTVLIAAVVLMAIATALSLPAELHRLLTDSNYYSAIDLKSRHEEVRQWLAGETVFGPRRAAAYPPASYLLLWPAIGWLPITPVRWLWAITSLLGIGWLGALAVREGRAATGPERMFAALLPAAMYATGGTIGNGQLALHVIPCAIIATLLLCGDRRRARSEPAAIALFLFALVKPTMAAPFFWILLFKGRRLRAPLAIVVAYCALTLAASHFQGGLEAAVGAWLEVVGRLVGRNLSYANVNTWLYAIGMAQWRLVVSLSVLAAQGAWSYRYRRAELWLHLAAAALVSRLWTYHALYDDVIILVPMIALLRFAKDSAIPDGRRAVAAALLALSAIAMIAPADRLFYGGNPWRFVVSVGHTLVWGAALAFFLFLAESERRAARSPRPDVT